MMYISCLIINPTKRNMPIICKLFSHEKLISVKKNAQNANILENTCTFVAVFIEIQNFYLYFQHNFLNGMNKFMYLTNGHPSMIKNTF